MQKGPWKNLVTFPFHADQAHVSSSFQQMHLSRALAESLARATFLLQGWQPLIAFF